MATQFLVFNTENVKKYVSFHSGMQILIFDLSVKLVFRSRDVYINVQRTEKHKLEAVLLDCKGEKNPVSVTITPEDVVQKDLTTSIQTVTYEAKGKQVLNTKCV